VRRGKSSRPGTELAGLLQCGHGPAIHILMYPLSGGVYAEPLAIGDPKNLLFAISPKPVTCGHALTIGGGAVYPELNFTLPTMSIEASTWPEVRAHYEEIAGMIRRAAARLQLPGLVVEFELLPPMTEHPAWGEEITGILAGGLATLHAETGSPARSALPPPISATGSGRRSSGPGRTLRS